MKTTKMLTILVVALGLMVCQAEVSEAAAMGTAFTYQGHLYDNNSVADDFYDFQFKLYDANVGGSKAANDVNVADVDVIDGYFTVELDFGSGVFDGNAVWLETGVRPGELNDSNAYTTLSPRQEITPTPYALYAESAGVDSDWMVSGNDMYSIPSGNVGIGTAGPGDKLDVTGHINSSESYKLDGATVLANAGTDNIFVGEDAGVSNTTGLSNSAVGYQALWSNTTGYYNSAMGYRALYTNTTGQSNSAMGRRALNRNTTGNKNSAMGYEALFANTTGYNNSAMGNGALQLNTIGGNNSAVGMNALYRNTTGNWNSAVGNWAGRNNSTGSGNVFLGHKAGYFETGDNKLYIANSEVNPPLIYGEFDTGKVGIDTNSPTEKLEVNGNVKATAFVGDGSGLTGIATGDSDWTISDSNMYTGAGVTGNVGIGTTSPSTKLEVSGVITANGGNSSNWNTAYGWGDHALAGYLTSYSETDPTVLASVKDGVSWSELSAIPAGFADGVDDVGIISETDPTVLASVKDGVSWSELSAIPAGFADGVDDIGGGDNLGNHIATQNIELNGNWLSGDGGNEGVYVNNLGNVGIGTTNPQSKLSVGGDGLSIASVYGYGTYGVYGSGSSHGVYGSGSFGVEGIGSMRGVSARCSDDSGDNYGVYAVAGSTGSNNAYGVRSIVSRDGTGEYWSGRFTSLFSGGTYYGLSADYRTGYGHDLAEYILDTKGDTEAGDVLAADPDNDESVIKSSIPYDSTVVGIVSTQPHFLMGMELIMDEETGERYEDVDAAQLSLAGRVPVKVTDENGPIERGDMLTTSSKPGYAMKWSLLDVGQAEDFEELKSMLAENERRRNAVVGKALGKLDSGDGKIVALVNLQ